MRNADMPAMPQQREWQDDMEVHAANPKSGAPPTEGTGITKREHFAAMALQGYAAAGSTGMPLPGEIARLAVETADAFLGELERTK